MKGSSLRALVVFCMVVWVATGMAATAAGEEITLRFQTWTSGIEREQWEEGIALFRAKYPHINVEVEFAPCCANEQLLVQHAAGSAPDVVMVRSINMPKLLEAGALLNLEPFIKRDPEVDADDFLPAGMEPYRHPVTGDRYAFPYDVSLMTALYFNQDAINEAGVQSPVALARQGAWNWDTLLEVARAVTRDADGDGTPERFGIGGLRGGPTREVMILKNGGSVLSPDKQGVTVNSAEARDALQYLVDLELEWHVAPRPGESGSFQTGGLAMTIDGSWLVVHYRDTVDWFSWDVGFLPNGPSGTRDVELMDNSAWGIWSGTKYPEEAWELLKTITSSSHLARIGSRGYIPPARLSAITAFLNLGEPPPNQAEILTRLEDYSVPRPFVGLMDSVRAEEIFNQYVNLAAIGEIPVTAALVNIENQLRALIAEERNR